MIDFSIEIISPFYLTDSEAVHHCRSGWVQEKHAHVGPGKEESRNKEEKGEEKKGEEGVNRE